MAVMKEEGWKHGETDERPRSGCESQPLRRAMDGKKKQYSRLYKGQTFQGKKGLLLLLPLLATTMPTDYQANRVCDLMKDCLHPRQIL